MGEILNPCNNFEIFSPLLFRELSFCKGHLVVPGHKCWWQSKNVVYIRWSLLDPPVKAFQIEVIPGKLKFEVALTPICTFSKVLTHCFVIFDQRFWTATNITDLEQQDDLYTKTIVVTLKWWKLQNYDMDLPHPPWFVPYVKCSQGKLQGLVFQIVS